MVKESNAQGSSCSEAQRSPAAFRCTEAELLAHSSHAQHFTFSFKYPPRVKQYNSIKDSDQFDFFHLLELPVLDILSANLQTFLSCTKKCYNKH